MTAVAAMSAALADALSPGEATYKANGNKGLATGEEAMTREWTSIDIDLSKYSDVLLAYNDLDDSFTQGAFDGWDGEDFEAYELQERRIYERYSNTVREFREAVVEAGKIAIDVLADRSRPVVKVFLKSAGAILEICDPFPDTANAPMSANDIYP